jgi:hypothetical protein
VYPELRSTAIDTVPVSEGECTGGVPVGDGNATMNCGTSSFERDFFFVHSSFFFLIMTRHMFVLMSRIAYQLDFSCNRR